MSKTFAFHDHQNKSLGLVRGLRELGWTPAVDPDLFLIDFDGVPYYQDMIRGYAERGAKVVMYPHGATGQLPLDIWEVSPEVSAYLAFSNGQAEIMRRFGYPHPVHVTGWHWCEQRPARTLGEEVGRVLFAPIHPLGNGYLHPLHEAANRKAFRDILLHYPGELVSVRLLGSPEDNGVWVEPGAEYHQAALDNSTADIDRADVVVSYGTFAYLAVARGVPTVMYGQDYRFFDGNSDGEVREARNWERYAKFMHYPVERLDQLPGSALSVAAWRDCFVGEQMTLGKLAAALDLIFRV